MRLSIVLTTPPIAPPPYSTVAGPRMTSIRSTANGETATALAPATLERHSGGACFNDARVEVARIVSAALGDTSLSVFVPGRPNDVH